VELLGWLERKEIEVQFGFGRPHPSSISWKRSASSRWKHARKKSIVAFRAGALPEIGRKRDHGIVCEPGSAHALREGCSGRWTRPESQWGNEASSVLKRTLLDERTHSALASLQFCARNARVNRPASNFLVAEWQQVVFLRSNVPKTFIARPNPCCYQFCSICVSNNCVIPLRALRKIQALVYF